MDALDRRHVLGACASGLSASLAGCLGGVLDSSSGGPSDGGFPGDGTVPDGARWFPVPEAFDRETYGAFSVNVSAFYEHRESLSSALTNELSELAWYPGVDGPGQIDSLYLVGNRASVVTGGFDRDAVIDFYTEEGFEQAGTREGFTLLEGTLGNVRPGQVFAIRDGAMVGATPVGVDDNQPIRPIVEAVVDAEAGAEARCHEANDAFRRLLEALPAGDTFGGGTGPPGESADGFLSNGTASSIGASTTELEAVVLFEEDAVDGQSLVDPATASDFFLGADVETTVDDGTLRATASVPTDQLEELPLGVL